MKNFIIFLILSTSVYSKDISVKMDEVGINKFLSAVDSYKNKTQVDFKISKMNITWKIYDGYLTLKPKDSIFTSKIEITTDNKIRNGTLEGEAKFSFDPKKQTLIVKIVDMKVRGLDIFNLVGFYSPKYELPIKVMQKDKISIKEDDKITGYLIPILYEEKVTALDGAILIEANIKFEQE